MILAISTVHVSRLEWQRFQGAEGHHARAASKLHQVFQSGGLETLHSILLLCQYRIGSPVHDSTGSLWHLVGIAARICFELGLHKDITYSSDTHTEHAPSSSESNERESRRRTFWCVVAMDRVTSIILGRPSAIRDEDVDHACPQEDLSLSTAYQSVTGHQLAFVFPHIVAYRLLYGEIAAKLHRKRPVGMDGRAALDLRTSLKDRLDAWYSSTVMSIRVEAQRAAKQVSCYTHPDWYELLRANAALMLWRPSPLLTGVSDEGQSVHAIFAAAKSAIHLYTGLHKAGHINHTSITLQAVFMAGLSYIYAVSRQFRQRMPNDTAELTDSMLGAQVPAIGEVISTTRACSNVLVAISERWNMTRHCCDVFDRLADAVLADAIKLQTTRYGAQPNTTQQRSRIEDTNASMTMWDPTENPGPPALNTAGQQVLAVDNEFIESYGDIQNLFDFQQFDDPIADLSEDWMGWIGLGAQENTLWNPTRA